MAGSPAPGTEVESSQSRTRLMPKSLTNLLGLVVALIVIFGFFSFKMPGTFASASNIQTLAVQGTIVCLLALGMTFVIVAGMIDLSVGSTVALVGVVIAKCLAMELSPLVAVLAGIGAGTLCGLLNGILVTKLNVGPFIVTLGSLLIFRGICTGIANEQAVYPPIKYQGSWLYKLLEVLGPEDKWRIVPNGVWLMILLAILVAAWLRYTRFGRHVVAVGSNESAARLCGVPIDRVKVAVFALMGVACGLAGMMQFARLTIGDPTVAVGFELEAIAAVVIGGASLSGGEGSIAGSILGALIMTTIRSGGSQMGLRDWTQNILTGAIIVGAVTLDRFRSKRG